MESTGEIWRKYIGNTGETQRNIMGKSETIEKHRGNTPILLGKYPGNTGGGGRNSGEIQMKH